MTDEQLEEKFEELCRGRLSDEQIRRTIGHARRLPELDSLDSILRALVI
jgi:uncharacterized protein (DUF1786 family)